MELLREEVPLVVLQRLLGHSNADLTAGYLNFSPDDEQRILNHHESNAKKLALTKGDKVWCYFKAMFVILVD